MTFRWQGIKIHKWEEELPQHRSVHIFSGAALFIFALLAAAASFRVVGVQPAEEDFGTAREFQYWPFRFFSALIIGFGLSVLASQTDQPRFYQSNIGQFPVFFFDLGVSAWLWAKEPVKPDCYRPQPGGCSLITEMYPDYDARNYDVMSQFAVIGRRINNHSFFDPGSFTGLPYLSA